MMHPIRRIVFCLIAAMAFSSCSPAEPHTATAAAPGPVAPPPPPPAAPREFRAAWIASVGNSNWPRPDRSSAEQQQDMIALLDRCVALNLNAVVLQIRPGADALYKSDLEPWSEYLTGVQGQAPSPYYDPLQMWVTEAHRRGLELHAWYNAYRVSPGAARKLRTELNRQNTPGDRSQIRYFPVDGPRRTACRPAHARGHHGYRPSLRHRRHPYR